LGALEPSLAAVVVVRALSAGLPAGQLLALVVLVWLHPYLAHRPTMQVVAAEPQVLLGLRAVLAAAVRA
jgi:hypothetical protein